MRFGSAVPLIAPFCLIVSLILAAPLQGRAEQAHLLSRFTWTDSARAFGGLSGLELAADGRTFRAISDRGRLLSGVLRREGDRITGVDGLRIVTLRNGFGSALGGAMSDAEGLVWQGGDEVVISFEGNHRLASFTSDGFLARQWPLVREFLGFEGNAGLEALAIAPDGALFALPETVSKDGKITAYRFAQGRWRVAFRAKGHRKFLPVGADFGPDGALYLLERHFTGFGFRSRIRRFELGPAQRPKRGGAVIWQSEARAFDNLEGLSVWRDGKGRLRLTMVSDDNFMRFQRTELVELVLDEALAKPQAKE